MRRTAPVSCRLSMAALSDIGRVRANNEDVVFADEVAGVALLADGLGGYRGGEVASALAVSVVAGDLVTAAAAAQDPAGTLRQAFQDANAAVFRQALAESHCRGMATTLVAAWAVGDRLWVANVGDSRVYHWRGGELRQVTSDHTVVQAQVAAGQLRPDEARRAQHRNLLTRAVGSEPGVDVDLHSHELRAGDRWLLCSDGLTDPLDDTDLGELLGRRAAPAVVARSLVDLANARGGHDNVSVIVVAVLAS